MLLSVIFMMLSCIAPSYQFSVARRLHSASHSLMLTSTKTDNQLLDAGTVTVRAANLDELPICAGFLSKNMYPSTVPRAQVNELQRLELLDLRSRYGLSSARKSAPSVFLVAVVEEEIIGCVGMDCQYFDQDKNKFRQIKSNKAIDTDREIIVVLSNLAVRRDKRKQKVAQKLLSACESYVKDTGNWKFRDIYLQVDSENLIAQKLYKKLNYKLIFEDQEATCIASGDYNLKTLECVNFCYKKQISSGGGGNPFEAIAGLFGGLFKK